MVRLYGNPDPQAAPEQGLQEPERHPDARPERQPHQRRPPRHLPQDEPPRVPLPPGRLCASLGIGYELEIWIYIKILFMERSIKMCLFN